MPNSYKSTIKPDEPALTTEMLGRRLAYPFALLAKRLGMSANAVTIIAGSCWMLSLLMPIAGAWRYSAAGAEASLPWWFAAGFLWNAGYILDIADGSLARMNGASSRRGSYLDYVFHLLSKPAFLASIAMGAGMMAAEFKAFWLAVAIISIPANWSAAGCAANHVLCEETGKTAQGIKRLLEQSAAASSAPASAPRPPLPTLELDPPTFARLWGGLTDINVKAGKKRLSPARFIKSCSQEIFSYYGQFTFFSLTVLADILAWRFAPALWNRLPMPATSLACAALTFALASRIPFRVAREYKRIALSDGVEL